MKVFSTLTPECRQNLLVLFAAGLLFWASLASLLPTLPLYIEHVGGDSQQIGVVMGSFAIGLLLFRAWLARLTDRQGRKLVLLIGVIAVAVAPLGYLGTESMALLILVRAFHGLSIAAFALAYNALVVDISPPARRGELIGYMSLVNPIGMALGPAMGGFVYEWLGFRPSFLAAAIAGLIGVICTTQIREAHSSAPGTAPSDQSHLFWRLLTSPRVQTPTLVLLLVGLAFGTLVTFVPLLVKESAVTLNVGLFYTAAAIASFGIRLLTGPASDRYGRGLFISISLVLYAIAMALLWQATSAETFLLAGVFEGCGAGILIPMMAALMADRSYPNERGRIFSLCMVGFDLGIAIAGPTLGTIAAYIGYRMIFGVAAALVLLGLIIFLACSGKDVIHSWQFATGRGRDLYALDPYPHLDNSDPIP